MEETSLVLLAKRMLKRGCPSLSAKPNLDLSAVTDRNPHYVQRKTILSAAFVPPSPHLHSGQVVFPPAGCIFRTLSNS